MNANGLGLGEVHNGFEVGLDRTDWAKYLRGHLYCQGLPQHALRSRPRRAWCLSTAPLQELPPAGSVPLLASR